VQLRLKRQRRAEQNGSNDLHWSNIVGVGSAVSYVERGESLLVHPKREVISGRLDVTCACYVVTFPAVGVEGIEE